MLNLSTIQRCAFSIPRLSNSARLFRRPLSSQILSQEDPSSAFEQDVKSIDPQVLAKAMGGMDHPPEEPLLSTCKEGYGYLPTVAVGRSLKQYLFVRKLGWAGFSSVWLALDKSAHTKTFVAMKILTTQSTGHILAEDSHEYEVFRKIASANPNSPGFNHLLTLRHVFTANSVAGPHICFVTDPLSSSLADLRTSGNNPFTVPIVKRVIKQVLLALDYLHRECGYIHADLKPDNILASIPPPVSPKIHEFIQASHPQIYGPPLELKSLPLPVVFSCSQPLPYLSLGGSLENISVRVMDYGEAIPIGMRVPRLQPALSRAPEVTLKYPWTSTIDIWTVGCLLFDLLTGQPLFNQDTKNYSDELHLQYIVELLGPLPPELLKESEDRGKYVDDQGMLLHTTSEFVPQFVPTILEDILRRLKAVDEDEIPGVVGFLRRCLTLDPNLRPTAQELLKDSWLV